MQKKPVVVAVALGGFALLIGFLLYFLWYNGVFLSKTSAAVGIESLTVNGKSYRSVTSENYTEGRTIARDGDWKIVEISEDPSRSFVVARLFLDQRLYVSEEYTIPTSGAVTKAYWNNGEIVDGAFLRAVENILAEKKTTCSFETEGVFRLTDTQRLRKLYLAYENCPVAMVYGGYLGKVNGKWLITTSQNTAGIIEAYEIPSAYTEILEKQFA